MVEVNHVDAEAHGEGVNAAAGNDQQSLSCWKVFDIRAHQTAEAGPVRVRDPQTRRQIALAGSIQGISRGTRYRHHNSWILPRGKNISVSCVRHQDSEQLDDG